MTVVTDDFERANSQTPTVNNLGANWSRFLGTNYLQLFSGNVYASAVNDYQWARHVTSIGSKHQYVQGHVGDLIFADATNTKALYLFARLPSTISTTASTQYALGAYIAYVASTFAGSCGMFYTVAGTSTFLAAGVSLGLNLAIGDSFRLEAQGQTMRLLYNDVVKIEGVCPVDIGDNQYAGIGAVSLGSQPYQIAHEDFEAGPLADPSKGFMAA